jgi:hypothetical protein
MSDDIDNKVAKTKNEPNITSATVYFKLDKHLKKCMLQKPHFLNCGSRQ